MNAHFLISQRCSATKKSLSYDFTHLDRLVWRKLRIRGSQHVAEVQWRLRNEKKNLFLTANKNYLCLNAVTDMMLIVFFKKLIDYRLLPELGNKYRLPYIPSK